MALAVIALGSNLGDSLGSVQRAAGALASLLTDFSLSPLYRTVPMYVADQPAFVNAAALGETDLGPWPLLQALKRLELDIGRQPRQRFGPREIDLDLISYGCVSYRFIQAGRIVLELPHPRLAERRFVLQPLADLAPNLDLPGLGRVAGLLAATESQAASVQRIEDAALQIQGVR
ncbi:MAG: 2-amino-4-hydroxy-6-hydroxymethyldihydropteridine diphosphokinase [Fimbriimonas ginsengisoli]|uniref:2-amino-4-hydroxy-6-hydroxymethyldihydropteridine diphosphokinase n=1 Tax=Fimbriimonas ginsengisoli TaxID=1005039 RepID=A0A931PTW0_FIMGI|nr:2-amino-4-hydroxy-6-hydroxymethyldihydropteridine diphosphokinase [Fimbriimonas ginsengisoli]